VEIGESIDVKWVSCHHAMAPPLVADGGDEIQMWRVDANILNRQSRTAEKGWSSSLGVGCRANNFPPCKKLSFYEMLHRASDLDGSFG
jgi:hypothetical protein